MINPEIREKANHYRKEFATARPFPYVVIDEFFSTVPAERLLEDFPPFNPANALNEFGEVGRKAAIADIRKISPFYAKVYDYIASPDFLEVISRITGIPELVHDYRMFGGGTHENLEGQELDAHVDFNFLDDQKLHRRLNLLLYLNKEWQESWGGCLELHSNPRRPGENHIKVIVPAFNRCVIFETSERSWHGFERIRLPQDKKHISRKLLSIYLYTRDRPAEEIVPQHGTFYVQRPLPAHIVAGHRLSEDDVTSIKELLVRRDGWIEYYHKKELRDSETIQSLARYAESLVPVDQLPVKGCAQQEGRVRGFWPDSWIGTDFEVALRLNHPAGRIVIRGDTPQETELRVSLNGVEVARPVVKPGADSFGIAVDVAKNELMKLNITSDKPYCPAEAGDSPDSRRLVLHLLELEVVAR
jgi:2OG-Fe(II) oxygenase superfamily